MSACKPQPNRSEQRYEGNECSRASADNVWLRTRPPEKNPVISRLHGSDDPTHWRALYKWTVMGLLSVMSMLGALATMTIIPAVPLILEELSPQDKSLYLTLIVSIWELGEGLGPMVIGPLTELFGRRPVLHGGNALFIAFLVGTALSTSVSMLVAFRFLAALCVTPLTLAPIVAGDLFGPEERGAAMALAMAFPLLAPPVAPVTGGFISAALGWRWTSWIVVIPSGLIALLLGILFQETHEPRRVTDQAALASDTPTEDRYHPLQKAPVVQIFLRPLHILAFAPSASILTIFLAIVYGMVYIVLTTLTEMLEATYGFDPSEVGLGFLGIAIGMILSTALYGATADRYLRYRSRSGHQMEAEDRLPFVLCGAILLPAGFLLYGWTAQYRVHWIFPVLGSGLLGFGTMLIQIPIENYLADAFEDWKASAISTAVILRALTGAVLPLAGPPLYDKLGFGWGNTALALIGIVFVPAIVVLVLHGRRFRFVVTQP